MEKLKLQGVCVQKEIVSTSFNEKAILHLAFEDELVKELVLKHSFLAGPPNTS